MHIYAFNELKASQSAMYLIRNKESGDVLLELQQPFERFVYRREGYWRELVLKTFRNWKLNIKKN